MEPLERVAVPLDGSTFARRALGPARLLATRLGVPVQLVAVRYGERRVDVETELQGYAWEAGIGVPEVVVVGDDLGSPPVLLADRLTAGTLVCMTTHARHGVGRAVLGSVAEELIRSLHRPIVLVGPEVDVERLLPFDEMLVCIDGSAASQAVLPEAVPIAARLGSKVRLVQVVHPDATVRARQQAEGAILDEEAFARVVQSIMTVPARGETVASGDPAAAIADLATSGSLVALVTHARRGLARAVLGSTSAAIVHRAAVPVMAFRPAGLPDV
jgi:nucleotide-binding universal stress UspA family protein